jgi:hypothetical protein
VIYRVIAFRRLFQPSAYAARLAVAHSSPQPRQILRVRPRILAPGSHANAQRHDTAAPQPEQYHYGGRGTRGNSKPASAEISALPTP